MTPPKHVLVDALQALVEVETPSGNLEALNRGFDVLESLVVDFTGRHPSIDRVEGVPYLYLAPTRTPSILIVGHLDTVWPIGTLTRIPFSVSSGRARGPGVFDMKAGLVIALGALAGSSVADHVGLLVTGDEETGSRTGRPVIERHFAGVEAVFVPEGAAPGGGLKKARKGVGIYEFAIHGLESHAGLEPERGINATVEMGALIADLLTLQGNAPGTTVTPTKASSGVTANTVPADATLYADVRAWTLADLERIDKALRERTPHVPGAAVTVGGGINRPPLEEDGSARIVELARRAAQDVGMGSIEAVGVGGASDGNFTAAAGIPTLDGVGAAGGGAHTRDEWVDIDSLSVRSQWLALVAERIIEGGLAPASP